MGSNKNHLTVLSNWLAPVAKSVNSLWKRCWRASVDGWAASTFHGSGGTFLEDTPVNLGVSAHCKRRLPYLCSYLHGYVVLKVQLDSFVLSNVEPI